MACCSPLLTSLYTIWIGWYADDLLLIAPTRGGMQQMLDVCEDWALRYNISFSTDPNPAKSKSKCIHMIGEKRNLGKPVNLMLKGMPLPWVTTATYLGHELHESGSMEHDAKVKRAEFIDKSVEIRETFGFASPVEVLQALKTYCSSFYGSMLWNLAGDGASQVFNSWNTAVKLAWSCPRETRTYLTQEVLYCGLDSARCDIISRYAKFFSSLRKSPSKEIVVLANLVSRNIRSTTGSNLRLVEDASGLSAWDSSPLKVKDATRTKEKAQIQAQDEWRIPYLSKLLGQRQELEYLCLISSLCIHYLHASS